MSLRPKVILDPKATEPKASTENNALPIEGEGTGRGSSAPTHYKGIPLADIIAKWWEFYNDGQPPVESNRNTLTFELAVNLRHICGFDRSLMDKVIPCYDGFSEDEKMSCIDSAINEKRTQMPKRLKDVLVAVRQDLMLKNAEQSADFTEALDDMFAEDEAYYYNKLGDMPQGIKESIDAVGPALTMPVITAICPCIGALATGVELDVHKKLRHLNLISYIAGDFASGKGSIDPVVEAWMYEVKTMDKIYQQEENEWRQKKRAALNKKEQPEEPRLPVRCLTLNNTVANLAERLANTEGKHGFSFTSEADTVAQKWKSSMCDFSVMLRQAYDNSPYDREARSAEAVNVHISKLLWNVTMCGTPDALYRVVNNYTDGFQSRIALARTPDNTFAPLEDNPYVLTDKMADNIQAVAHLLQLMVGQVVLPNLEQQGRDWLEKVRLDAMKNDDKVKARQRMRICVTAQRMTCCLMLCKVAEVLLDMYGRNGAELRMKQDPRLWKEELLKVDASSLIEAFDVIADSLLDNALHFFRSRIENAFASRDYVGSETSERVKVGKNDNIFNRLDVQFSLQQAQQHTIAIKGAGITQNAVRQMLKNWRRQGLIEKIQDGMFRKI